MDDDLEDELMDLETNECAYLPQAAHSGGRPSTASAVTVSPTLRGRSALPASLAGRLGGHPSPLQPAAMAPLPPPPSPLNASPQAKEVTAAGQSAEEPVGWYDQIEMLLAAAESKYFDWVDQVDMPGTVSEEALRTAEAERVKRRGVTVARLKKDRHFVVQQKLVECTRVPTRPRTSSGDGFVDMDEMMDTLAAVVDGSAKQLDFLRRQAMWTRLATDLPHQEPDYVAKGADEMFGEKMKYKRDPEETRAIVEQHLQSLFKYQPPTRNGQSVARQMNHSLGQMVREFAEIFHHCYSDPSVKAALSARDSSVAATTILPLVAADINQFAPILVQVLHYKYPEIPRSWSNSVVHRCVIDALFEHLQPTLHALYAVAFERENAFLNRLCQQMRPSRLGQFGIKPVFRLDGSWSPTAAAHGAGLHDANELQLRSLRNFEPLIQRMNAMTAHRSPWVKAEVLAAICRDVDRCVKGFYLMQSGAPPPPLTALSLTADDLSALLAFLLVSAPTACTHIATQLALLGSFMASESAMGEEGFAIATLWTAVNHLCHLT